MEARWVLPYRRESSPLSVPDWLVLYAVLGLADLALTLAAFQYGATEANPVLRSLVTVGLFEFTKLSLTLLVLCIGYRFRCNRIVVGSIVIANAVMVGVTVYHVSNFAVFL